MKKLITRNKVITTMVASILLGSPAMGITYLKDKMVGDADADVNVTIMRWGVSVLGQKDCIIGQVASNKYRAVKLIFESGSAGSKKYVLTIQTPVHRLGRQGKCTFPLCPNSKQAEYRGGNKGKGASASGGCYFNIEINAIPKIKSFRLVDVQAIPDPSLEESTADIASSPSVTYCVTFNVSPDLVRTSFAVPIPPKAIFHPPLSYSVDPR